MPVVSIVTPAYNEEDFLEYALDSVRNQTYDAIEHIVVDDGSTDQTSEILERYEEEYNLKTIRQSNQGRPAAMNRGLEEVNGDIVFWLNADDVIFQKNTIEIVVDYFRSNPDVDIVYGNLAIIDPNNNLDEVRVNYPWFSSERLLRTCFAEFNYMRSTVVDNHKMNSDYQHALDYDYFLKLASEGLTFGYINTVLYCYRQHEDTTAVKTREERTREVTDIQNHYENKMGINNGFRSELRFVMRGLLNQLIQIYALFMIWKSYKNKENIAFPIQFNSILKIVYRSLIPIS